MKLKNMLGLCSCKGCKEKYSFDMEMTRSNGKKIKHKLCVKHAMKLLDLSEVKSVTVEQKINLGK